MTQRILPAQGFTHITVDISVCQGNPIPFQGCYTGPGAPQALENHSSPVHLGEAQGEEEANLQKP